MRNFARSRCQYHCPGGALAGSQVLFIATAAFALVVPFFFLGIPSGHDFEFHLNSWMEVLDQWHQGIIYPRWAALAQYGYGEARFVFYPPVSWLLGAALGWVLPWKIVPGTYVWLALTFSGCSMFVLSRRWLNRSDAMFAAAAYAVNPYHIVIVVWRSAYAELLASALVPLVPLYVIKIDEDGRNAIVPLALIVAAATLTNAPTSVMVNYSIMLLALTLAILRRSPKILLYTAIAGLLGAALAAFYVLPAFYEEKWVNIAQVLSPGVRPQDNFLFTTIADSAHNRFNRLISLVAAAEVIVLAIAVSKSCWQRREHPQLWWFSVLWALASTLLMFSFSAVFWRHLPLLRFMQLPWRWLLCLNAALVPLLTMAWKRWLGRVTALLLMLVVLGFVWQRVQPPWWDTAVDIAGMATRHQTGAGYEGTDEYVPAGADPYEVKQDAPLVALNTGGPLRVQVEVWKPETKSFLVEASHPGKLVLRLFNYPAWQAQVNGRRVETETHDNTGQMLISVAAGESVVRIKLIRTWDRTVGGIVSLLSVAGLLLWFASGLLRS
jgi:hypothetical protein